jgi:thiopeptide-type bacteriocin biosynthesis protein
MTYVPLDAALLRASTESGDLAPGDFPNLDDARELDQSCAWLANAWPRVADAVSVASPSLAAQIETVRAGRRPRPREVRRMVIALSRYLVRMTGRATPFGTFAGIANLGFGDVPLVSWEPERAWTRCRADGVWLSRAIASLEADPAVRSQLVVTVNDTLLSRGDRLVVAWQPHASDSSRSASTEVSVRRTQAVELVIEHARSPIVVADLIGKLAPDLPDIPLAALDEMVARLLAGGVLISCLRPPATSTDGLGHVVGQVPDNRELLEIHALLASDSAAAPGWRDYHSCFLARYGVNAVVSIHDLVDPACGIGYPEHFGAGEQDLPVALSRRDTRLLALAQQAALDGQRVVVLDDGFIDLLHPEPPRPSPHLEMCAEIWCPSLAALTRGAFQLVVSGVSRTGVALSGRFLELLPSGERQHRIDQYGKLPTLVDEAVPAQLSFPPRHPHLENITRTPRLLPDLIPLAEHRTDDGLRIGDLAVTADSRGMYLISLSRRRIVEPLLAHAAARRTMPPLARLLFELPRARIAATSPFAWGAARCLPFLPRVVYGRTILCPARWRIPDQELPAPGVPMEQWRRAFEVLRDRLGLPETVSIGDSDLRLRLNVDEPMHLAVLRDYLDKARKSGEPLLISEASIPADHGWFDGRAHELIIPLADSTAPASAPAVLTRPGPLTIVSRNDAVLPGGNVVYAKLYGDPLVVDEILTDYLPQLWSDWREPPQWWFVRYRDPEPHLRLRLHLDNEEFGDAVTHLAAWASRLRDSGLIKELTFATYYPETARYGSGEALRAAETLFAADSAATVAQLSTRFGDPQALTSASLVDLVIALTGSVPDGMRWLIDHGDIGPTAPSHRHIVQQAVALADRANLLSLPGGREIDAAWGQRCKAAEAYRRHLDGTHLEPGPVLRSLLHMHHVRSHGIDLDHERACNRLARAVALSWTARHSSSRSR